MDEQYRVAFPLVPEGDVRDRCEEVVFRRHEHRLELNGVLSFSA
ncbi:hypothetical protein [Actinacidiphila glaucinigra]